MTDKYTLGKRDFVKGLITTIIASILTVFYTVTQQPGFDVFATDWSLVGTNVVNVAVITMMSYLIKNGLTNSNDEFLGK